MRITLYGGGPLDKTADWIVAGEGICTLKRLFGLCFPSLQIACEIRGLPPLLASFAAAGEANASLPSIALAPTYHVLTLDMPLPVFDPGRLYQYIIARNGVFLLARSQDMEVCLPLATGDLPGLATCTSFVRFLHPIIPPNLVEDLFASARAACQTESGAQERLFYLLEKEGEWSLVIPDQEASEWSVRARTSTRESFVAVLEGHSHHRAAAYFSHGDDEAELLHGGCRIFFVLGQIESQPEILVRICVHGYAWLLPATLFFELPPSVHDACCARSWEGTAP